MWKATAHTYFKVGFIENQSFSISEAEGLSSNLGRFTMFTCIENARNVKRKYFCGIENYTSLNVKKYAWVNLIYFQQIRVRISPKPQRMESCNAQETKNLGLTAILHVIKIFT